MTSGTLAGGEGTGPVVRDTSQPKQFVAGARPVKRNVMTCPLLSPLTAPLARRAADRLVRQREFRGLRRG